MKPRYGIGGGDDDDDDEPTALPTFPSYAI
jgi:hypothetical protein